MKVNKLYTPEQYAKKVSEASKEGKIVYILETTEDDIKTESLIMAPKGYYIVSKGIYTDGTVNENYEADIEAEKRKQFEKEFFSTSLGYVRRSVRMKDGTTKNFLFDLLPRLQVGVPILTYTAEGEQQRVLVTQEFIAECDNQIFTDFYG